MQNTVELSTLKQAYDKEGKFVGLSSSTNSISHNKFSIGQTWKTRGGWPAQIIWVTYSENSINWTACYAIHQPKTNEESFPIAHSNGGRAQVGFSVSEPPSYNQHPADLMELVK